MNISLQPNDEHFSDQTKVYDDIGEEMLLHAFEGKLLQVKMTKFHIKHSFNKSFTNAYTYVYYAYVPVRLQCMHFCIRSNGIWKIVYNDGKARRRSRRNNPTDL